MTDEANQQPPTAVSTEQDSEAAATAVSLSESTEDQPAAINFSGDWIGNVFGTNTGKVYARIEQHGQTVSGEVRLMDDTSGPNVFAISGTADERLVGELNPTQIPEGAEAAPGTVELELGTDGRLHGRWGTQLGTGGVVTLARFTLPSDIKGQEPLPQVVTPLRVFSDNESIGAIRLGEDGVRRIVEAVEQNFSTVRAVVTFRPKGRRAVTAHADDFLANSRPDDVLHSLTIGIQETEPNGINRGVNVELAEVGQSTVRTYGTDELWVTGKMRMVTAEVRRHERALVTSYKRYGLDFNAVIFLLAIAFLPNTDAWLRVTYLLGVVAILAGLRHVHAKLIPLTEIVLGPAKPSTWSRVGAPVISWLLGLGSAVLVKLLSDLVSNSDLLQRVFGGQ